MHTDTGGKILYAGLQSVHREENASSLRRLVGIQKSRVIVHISKWILKTEIGSLYYGLTSESQVLIKQLQLKGHKPLYSSKFLFLNNPLL